MTVPSSPTVRRRRLAAELREIRESKGKSGDAVAAALKWSPSKISRYERARTGLQPREVERLLDYYEITGARRTLLLALAQEPPRRDGGKNSPMSFPPTISSSLASSMRPARWPSGTLMSCLAFYKHKPTPGT
jgi:transcriptional regulator with XRE-family HTH domain